MRAPAAETISPGVVNRARRLLRPCITSRSRCRARCRAAGLRPLPRWRIKARHECRHHLRRRVLRRAVELSFALRAAAGAALSRVSRRRVARTLRRWRDRTPGQARDGACGAAVRRRILHRVRRLRRERERGRRARPGVVARARDHRRRRDHRDGPALSRHHPLRLPDVREAGTDGAAGRAVGRLCHGARLRVRLDAVHRADPRGDPRGRGVARDRGQGRDAARGLFGRARHSVPARGVRHRAVRGADRPLQAPS